MKTDRYDYGRGEIRITPIGHGSLMMEYQQKIIHVDPYSRAGDYLALPKADLVLITHNHYDHYDPEALAEVSKPGTLIIADPATARAEQWRSTALRNGDKTQWNGIGIEAVPAYNIVQMRSPGIPFHPRGAGNGYILRVGDLNIYIAGDTELIPEMECLGPVDIAFLPKNLPYTMSDSMFIEAARTVRPGVLYPYHYFEINYDTLKEALPGIDIR